ncbi:hypothetical protein [Thermanaerothrix daxensis]|uniref:hypothetical protein n=1 Tax=Thermanaerothrix daxensis TaxID=869279 RepID=UPI0006C8E748|nr:hypothetical protein [Thermanaerothrix daxensis]
MSESRWRIIGGVALILAGLLALVSLWFEVNLAGVVWGILLAVGGVIFLGVLLSNREAWWAAFPAFPLLGIAALILLGTFAPQATRYWGGALVLGSIGLSFVVVYLLRREFWWAIIPAGTMLTLALVTLAESLLPGASGGWVFFAGLGLTFLVLYLLPGPGGTHMTWPLYPAGILLVLSLLLFLGTTALGRFFWPLALILVGVFLVYRALRGTRS